jgi:hypothetical protein
MKEILTAPELSRCAARNADNRFSRRLFLLREPFADMLDVVEDEAADLQWQSESAGSEALQRADRSIQLPREVGFADVAVENRRGWI